MFALSEIGTKVKSLKIKYSKLWAAVETLVATSMNPQRVILIFLPGDICCVKS